MSQHPWDRFSVFLASAAISSLYYIANPSDHSTKTQHLFRNPPFMQTLSGSSNRICWWIARNSHLITSHTSAAWNAIAAFCCGRMDRLKRKLGRSRLCRHVDMWSWSRVTGQSAPCRSFLSQDWLSSGRACRCCSGAPPRLQPHTQMLHRIIGWLTAARPANGLICYSVCVMLAVCFIKNQLASVCFYRQMLWRTAGPSRLFYRSPVRSRLVQ